MTTRNQIVPDLDAVVGGFTFRTTPPFLAVLTCAMIVFVCAGCATGSATTDKVKPASYRVVLENEQIRVIEYNTGSEKDVCGFGMHTHPAHLYIMKTDAKLRIVTPDGKESFENSKAGDVGWAPVEQHLVENLSRK